MQRQKYDSRFRVSQKEDFKEVYWNKDQFKSQSLVVSKSVLWVCSANISVWHLLQSPLCIYSSILESERKPLQQVILAHSTHTLVFCAGDPYLQLAPSLSSRLWPSVRVEDQQSEWRDHSKSAQNVSIIKPVTTGPVNRSFCFKGFPALGQTGSTGLVAHSKDPLPLNVFLCPASLPPIFLTQWRSSQSVSLQLIHNPAQVSLRQPQYSAYSWWLWWWIWVV